MDMRERIRERVTTLTEVAEELAGRRFHAASEQGRVRAEVDHRERVVAIRFVDTLLTRVRVRELSAEVVAAVAAARAEASTASMELLVDRLGPPPGEPR